MRIADVVLIALGVLLFLIYFALLLVFAKKDEKQEKNSLLNSFPFQYYGAMKGVKSLVLMLLLGLSGLLVSTGVVLYCYRESSGYQLILGICFAVSLIALIASNMLSFEKYKAHLICAFISFVFLSMSLFLMPFRQFIQGEFPSYYTYTKIIEIFAACIGAVIFLALFNPKLLNWAKMEKAEENGKAYYIKPKVNYLALYEWTALIIIQVMSILFMVDDIVKFVGMQ